MDWSLLGKKRLYQSRRTNLLLHESITGAIKKEEVKELIRKYIALRKKIDFLHGELLDVRDRFGTMVDLATLRKKEDQLLGELRKVRHDSEKTAELLFVYRSRDFIRSVISRVLDLGPEYGKDKYYHNFLTSLISIVIHFEEYEAELNKQGSQGLLYLEDEKGE